MREQFLSQDGMPPAQVIQGLPPLPSERPDDANSRKGLAHAAVDLFDVLPDIPINGPDASG